MRECGTHQAPVRRSSCPERLTRRVGGAVYRPDRRLGVRCSPRPVVARGRSAVTDRGCSRLRSARCRPRRSARTRPRRTGRPPSRSAHAVGGTARDPDALPHLRCERVPVDFHFQAGVQNLPPLVPGRMPLRAEPVAGRHGDHLDGDLLVEDQLFEASPRTLVDQHRGLLRNSGFRQRSAANGPGRTDRSQSYVRPARPTDRPGGRPRSHRDGTPRDREWAGCRSFQRGRSLTGKESTEPWAVPDVVAVARSGDGDGDASIFADRA